MLNNFKKHCFLIEYKFYQWRPEGIEPDKKQKNSQKW